MISRPSTRVPLVLAALVAALWGCGMTVAQEDEIGDIYAESILQQLDIVRDTAIDAALSSIGRRLTLVADDASRDWHFYLVNDSVVNAFAVPGGHIFVHRGLVERAGSYSELAGVLAHEIAHVTLRHSMDQLRARTRTNALVSIFCSVTGFCGSTVAQIALGVGGDMLFASYSREDESESDSAAVAILAEVGIDPSGIPAMFERLAAARQSEPSALEAWFASHPQESDRVERTRRLLARYPVVVRQEATDSVVFARLKESVTSFP